MPTKKHTVEQMVVKLREVEKLTGQGMTIPQAAKRIGTRTRRGETDVTYRTATAVSK
jgi:transposase